VTEKLFTYICCCRECGEELNRAEGVPESDKTFVVIGAPLMVGKCPKGCRSTFSDCNLRYVGEWMEEP